MAGRKRKVSSEGVNPLVVGDFAALLIWHMDHGTSPKRPLGPGPDRWKTSDISLALNVSHTAVGAWRSGRSLPELYFEELCKHFFGNGLAHPEAHEVFKTSYNRALTDRANRGALRRSPTVPEGGEQRAQQPSVPGASHAAGRPISIGVREEIEHEFESSPRARQAMVHRDVLPDGRLSCPSAAVDLADALMQMTEAGEFQAALRWLKGGHDHLAAALRKNPDANGAASGQKALLNIASVLTPLGYRLSASFPIPAQSLAGGAPVWGVQAKMEAVAEILVAALHERPVSFRAKRREQDDPCGDLKLTMPPEAGDEDVGDLKSRLLSMLNCAFTPGDAAGLREALWEFLDYQFAGRLPRRRASGSSAGPGIDPAAQAARAGRIKASRENEDRGQQKYLVFPKQVTQEGSDALEKMLQDISAQVGGLPCVGLYGDEHVEVREIQFFGRLIAMLPVAAR